MTEKLTCEDEWIDALVGLPAFSLPTGPVIFVAPHPDDEVLGVGGLLAALREFGIPVTILALTDGDAAYSPKGDPELAGLRRYEQSLALHLLGVGDAQVIRLGLPDRHVSEYEPTVTAKLVTLLKTSGSTATLIAPWSGDFHSDHEASGRAAEVAASRVGCRLVRWFWWSWHRRGIAEVVALPLRKFCLEPRWLNLKLAALAEHRSQLGADAILPKDLLAPAYRDFEIFA